MKRVVVNAAISDFWSVSLSSFLVQARLWPPLPAPLPPWPLRDSLNPSVTRYGATASCVGPSVPTMKRLAPSQRERRLSSRAGSRCAPVRGHGHLHLLNGLYDAKPARAPVFALASTIPSAEVGGSYFQEPDPGTVFESCSGYNATCSTPSGCPASSRWRSSMPLAARASLWSRWRVTRRRRTPVWVPWRRTASSSGPDVFSSDGDIDAVAEAIDSHRKVTIYCGAGARNAQCRGARAAGRHRGHTPRRRDGPRPGGSAAIRCRWRPQPRRVRHRGTVRGAVDEARCLGAEEVYDTEAVDVVGALRACHPDGIDTVLDLVNRPARSAATLRILKPGGSLVSTLYAATKRGSPSARSRRDTFRRSRTLCHRRKG